MNILNDIFAGLDQDPRLDDTQTLEHGHIASAADARRFMTAGNATVTIKSLRTQTRFTYRVKASDDKNMLFVSALTGSNNEADYQYIGHIPVRSNIFFRGKKSKITEGAPSVVAFSWTWRQLLANRPLDQIEVWHEGTCGRCGRKLTVPQSIATGFGPECAEKVGL